MTDARLIEREVDDRLWLLDPDEAGARDRWLSSDIHITLGEATA